MMAAMPLLQIQRLHKSFSERPVLNDITFGVDDGEILCLLGPSGCGKTTLLRIIAGLETPDTGTITFDGRDVRAVAVHQRGFGLMFQDFALFPHQNVWDNVIFGLRMQNLPHDQIQQLGLNALEMVGLRGFEKRDVNQLSGGERQRVALARSLAPKPKLLMLDEPLGSLDRQLREELMIELRRILKNARLTSIYVTHDQQEAFAIADRVVILYAGQVEQIGTPPKVYARPASEFVARFLGLPNLIQGTVIRRAANVAAIRTAIGQLHVAMESAVRPDQAVTLLIRTDAAEIDRNPLGSAETPANVIEGTVIDVSFRGRYQRLVVRIDAVNLVFEVETRSGLPAIGQPVRIRLRDDSTVVLR
jgi:ABC-type Fe3+/spermidine/putrescine transport system ATPase subunit